MPKPPPAIHEWGAVDDTSDPAWYIQFLDVARAGQLQRIQQDPRLYFSFLAAREGHAILDVGCGVGALLHPLAELVGPTGRVVGVDYSQAMITEAQHRAAGRGLALEFRQGSVYALDFADNTFDACNATNLFQHLEEPQRALAEMVRVTRAGGRVALFEPDWETHIINVGARPVTRKILNFICDGYRNGWIGRQLPALLAEQSLRDIAVLPTTVLLTQELWSSQRLGWMVQVDRAAQANVITAAERATWLHELAQQADTGQFFAAFTFFRVIGNKR